MKSQLTHKQWLKPLGILIPLLFSAQSWAITLNEAVEDAIIHSPEFRDQVKAAQGLQADLRGAKAAYYPKIDLSTGIGYEEVKNNTTDTTGDGLTRREASIRVSQNLFEGFGTKYDVTRVQAKLDAQKYKALDQANQTALDMVKAYLSLLKEEKLLRLAEDNRDTHQKILDQIIERQKAGIGNKVEVDQARARLYLAETNFASEKNNYYDAKARFHRVLGRTIDNHLVEPKFHFQLPSTLQEAIDQALLQHPTLLSANADLVETQNQVKVNRSLYYPKLDLELSKTYNQDVNGIKGTDENLQLMLRLRYNLFNGGADKSKVDSAIADYQRSAEIRNHSRRQAIEAVRYSWNAMESIQQQINYQKLHIKMTHDTLIGYRKQFSLGRRSLLDLLNTEDEYNSAMRELVKSESDLATAKYRILHDTGALLPAFKIDLGLLKVNNSYDDL